VGSTAGALPVSLSGETIALGADFGASDEVQLGLGAALPIHPGAGFGSVLASAAVAMNRSFALRTDAGFENIGPNGDNTGSLGHTGAVHLGISTTWATAGPG